MPVQRGGHLPHCNPTLPYSPYLPILPTLFLCLFNAVGTYDGFTVVAVGDGGLVWYALGSATRVLPSTTSWVVSSSVRCTHTYRSHPYTHCTVKDTHIHIYPLVGEYHTFSHPSHPSFLSSIPQAVAVNPSKYPLYCVSFGAPLVAYAGGKQATLMKTTDGGASWTSLYPALRTLNVVSITDHIM